MTAPPLSSIKHAGVGSLDSWRPTYTSQERSSRDRVLPALTEGSSPAGMYGRRYGAEESAAPLR
jgi:hypothetical protein